MPLALEKSTGQYLSPSELSAAENPPSPPDLKLNQRKGLRADLVGQIKCTVLIIEQYMLQRSEKP